MANTIICTNPMCGKEIRFEPKAFQVICPSCNTWHLVPEEGDESMNFGRGDEDFLPEDFSSPLIPPNEILPDLLEVEKPANENLPLSTQVEPGFIITESGDRYELKIGKNVIGRKAPDISIQDKTISRVHCVIEVIKIDDETLEQYIYDIGHETGEASTNGVFLSGRSQRLQDYEKVPLHEGTTVTLGNISFKLNK